MTRGLTIAWLAALLAAACSSSTPTPTTSGGTTTSAAIAGATSVTGTTGGTTSASGTTGGSTSGGSGTSASGTGGGTTTGSPGTTGASSGTSSSSTGHANGGGIVIGDGGLMAMGQQYPISIVIVPGTGGVRVFWANQGTSSEQGAIVQLLSDGGTEDFSAWEPDFLTSGNGNLYWSENVPIDAGVSLSLILAASLDDPGHPVLLIDGGAPYGIAVDSNSLYWEDLDPNSPNEYIRALDLDAGTVTNILAAMTNLILGAIAVDSENVYWADLPRQASTYRVLKAPKNGDGSATVLADNQLAVSAIAVGSSFVYWLTNSAQPDGGLWRASIDGGTAENLCWEDVYPMAAAMAVDTTNVYWGASNDMLSTPLAGGGATVLAGYLSATVITSIAVYSDYVCWTVLRQLGPLVGDVYCLPK